MTTQHTCYILKATVGVIGTWYVPQIVSLRQAFACVMEKPEQSVPKSRNKCKTRINISANNILFIIWFKKKSGEIYEKERESTIRDRIYLITRKEGTWVLHVPF